VRASGGFEAGFETSAKSKRLITPQLVVFVDGDCGDRDLNLTANPRYRSDFRSSNLPFRISDSQIVRRKSAATGI
jgi:hypothetical protein